MTISKIQQDFVLGFDIPALPGMAEADIQTPCLIIDLDQLENNLKRMADILAPYDVTLRAHAKMHKSVDVARQQHKIGGASGICCQKISEAEVFARAGIADILVTNQVCDPLKITRLAGIAATGCRLSVCVDDLANIAALSAEAVKQNTQIRCLVELECGAGGCGVSHPDEVTALAVAIDAADGLIFDGLQAYHGSIQHDKGYGQRKQVLDHVIMKVKARLESLSQAGLTCRWSAAAGQAVFCLRPLLVFIQNFNAVLMRSWMPIMAGCRTRTATGWIRPNGRMRCLF